MKIVITILAIVLLTLVVGTGSYLAYNNYQIRQIDKEEWSDSLKTKNIDEVELLEQVQIWREEGGLSRYQASPELCTFAVQRLSEIKQDWSHGGFIKNNQNFQKENGFNGMAENLSKDSDSELQTVIGWANSPEHLKNLKADYKYTCLKCEDNYCVHEFGNK